MRRRVLQLLPTGLRQRTNCYRLEWYPIEERQAARFGMMTVKFSFLL